MSTLNLEWNQDLVLSANGSLQMVDGWEEVRERIIRRILTNSAQTLPDGTTTAPDYVFHPSYGVGGGALVSQNPTQAFLSNLQQRIRSGVLDDASVDPGYAPQVVIQQPVPNTFIILVGCQLLNGQQGALSIAVGG